MRRPLRQATCHGILALILVLPSVVSAQEPAQHDLTSPRVENAGLLSEAAWEQAAVVDELVTLGAMAEPAEDRTRARVMHD
ncbi:MAG: hypothetical protein ACOCX2_10070, partial [Armatimonadota bacterium]